MCLLHVILFRQFTKDHHINYREPAVKRGHCLFVSSLHSIVLPRFKKLWMWPPTPIIKMKNHKFIHCQELSVNLLLKKYMKKSFSWNSLIIIFRLVAIYTISMHMKWAPWLYAWIKQLCVQCASAFQWFIEILRENNILFDPYFFQYKSNPCGIATVTHLHWWSKTIPYYVIMVHRSR